MIGKIRKINTTIAMINDWENENNKQQHCNDWEMKKINHHHCNDWENGETPESYFSFPAV